MHITKKRFEEKFPGYIELIYFKHTPERLHMYCDSYLNIENEEEYARLTLLISNFFLYHQDKTQEIIYNRLYEIIENNFSTDLIPVAELQKIFESIGKELLPIIYSKFHFI